MDPGNTCHADHLPAARHVQRQVGGRIAIGEQIQEVQATFKRLYNLERNFLPDGSHFDHLFKDGETFRIGNTVATALLVPGHTPADMAYLVDGAAYVGDTLFMPDVGPARAEFPGGDARVLFRSMRRILSLPPQTRFVDADRKLSHWGCGGILGLPFEVVHVFIRRPYSRR